jgi:hypothetical protein
MPTHLFDSVPLVILVLGTVLVVFIALELGFRAGQWRQNRSGTEHDGTLGGVVAATLGLLAFLLAFTFDMAAKRFEGRQHALLEEVNALDSAYLRADLQDEPHRSAVRDLLRKYVALRIDEARTRELAQAVERPEQMQKELWNHAAELGRAEPSSEMKALFVDSVNGVVETYNERLDLARHNIPTTIWLALYLMTIAAMASVGYQSGVSGPRRSPSILALALTFCLVIALIADLDRPLQGLLTVSQQPMVDLQQKMATSP